MIRFAPCPFSKIGDPLPPLNYSPLGWVEQRVGKTDPLLVVEDGKLLGIMPLHIQAQMISDVLVGRSSPSRWWLEPPHFHPRSYFCFSKERWLRAAYAKWGGRPEDKEERRALLRRINRDLQVELFAAWVELGRPLLTEQEARDEWMGYRSRVWRHGR